MLIAFFIILALFLLPDLYIGFAFLRETTLLWRLLFFVPSVLGLASLVGMRYCGFSSAFGTIFLVALLCFALPKFVFVLISLIAKLFGLWSPTAFSIVNVIGIVTACVVSLMALYGLVFGWKQLEINHVDLYFEDLPKAFDGYRIAHLSDLHVGTYKGKTAFLEKVVSRVNAENPDLVVFTGDLVNTEPEEILPYKPLLSSFTAPDGVFSVLGNHDYCLYGHPERWENPREGGLKVAELERSLGWKVLMNESRVLQKGSERIAIAGVENTGKPPFPQIGDLQAALKDVTDYDFVKSDENLFTILLSHDPSHWRMEILPKTHVPLTLCGHTHAAQLKIGNWSPSKWLYDEWSGLYRSENQMVYVSQGVGGTLPFRFGARPTVIVFTLHSR